MLSTYIKKVYRYALVELEDCVYIEYDVLNYKKEKTMAEF